MQKETTLHLHFTSQSKIELFRVDFRLHREERTLTSIRGKTSGAFTGSGSFQWTRAVEALSILLLRHKLCVLNLPNWQAILSGENDSLASSLDYAITKGPNWICEMFGTTANGELVAKRLFKRTNSNRKLPGPVYISVNERLLSYDEIAITIDGKLLSDGRDIINLLRNLSEIENLKNENIEMPWYFQPFVEENSLRAKASVT